MGVAIQILAALLYTVLYISTLPRFYIYEYIHVDSELQGRPEAIVSALIGHPAKK